MDYNLIIKPLRDAIRQDSTNPNDSLSDIKNPLCDLPPTAYYKIKTKTICIVTCFEKEIEYILNHELLHHVLAKIVDSETSILFDNITTKVYFELIETWNISDIGF
jgi:hypothetical protein